MSLARVNLLACGLFVIVVEDLEFAHAVIGSIAVAGVADGQAVVAAGRQLDFHAGYEVAVFFGGVKGAAFVGPALEGAINHLVRVCWPGPAGQIAAVEDGAEAVLAVAGEDPVGLVGPDFAHEQVAPANFPAMGLELDRALEGHRSLAVVVILEQGMVHHELAIEPDADARADHEDADLVPLAERLVGQDQRVFTGSAGAVVPEAAGALVGAQGELRLLGVIPDLDLGAAPQVNARIGLGDRLVLKEQLEVAVILLRGGVGALAVVDQLGA